MALAYADRVQETSTTTGTGTYSLAGAVAGFRTFVAGIGDTNICYYCATDNTDWEVGLGTVTDAATDTLSRTTILASSNAGAAVNWAAGTRNIFCTIPATIVSGLNGQIVVTKATNQTVATSTVYQSDTALTFAVAASTKYKFKIRLIIDTPSGADIKVQLTGPAAPTALQYSAFAHDNVGATLGDVGTAFSTSIPMAFGGGSKAVYVEINGYLNNGANSGTVTVQWGQVVSSGTTTVYMGSDIEYAVIQ